MTTIVEDLEMGDFELDLLDELTVTEVDSPALIWGTLAPDYIHAVTAHPWDASLLEFEPWGLEIEPVRDDFLNLHDAIARIRQTIGSFSTQFLPILGVA